MPKKQQQIANKNAIRNKYQELGVEQYYAQHGAEYDNPHFAQIHQLLVQNQSRLDYSNVLDFCCGSGEVSLVLKELGFETNASDPFTFEAYAKNLGKACLKYSFEDIVKSPLDDQFSTIICSFAMHLCSDDQLFPLVYNLFQSTSTLVIITPHKRPELEKYEGINLSFEDFALTYRGKKVRLKAYSSNF